MWQLFLKCISLLTWVTPDYAIGTNLNAVFDPLESLLETTDQIKYTCYLSVEPCGLSPEY